MKKSIAGTELMFIKVPGKNDKISCESNSKWAANDMHPKRTPGQNLFDKFVFIIFRITRIEQMKVKIHLFLFYKKFKGGIINIIINI